jgi:hypothetical protein
LPELLGQPHVTLLGFSRGELHGEVEKSVLVAFCVALDEPDKLLC